ncbi:STAS domain-containing protein [Streptomyces sp. NPDC046876]|uniref:STAS domain-containing protein n=1 Tax=Streptomyces sp. NPDC046876 TaxID=3155616 RepID=UPI0033CB2353
MHVRTHPDKTVVTLAGEIDLDTSSQVTEATAALPLEGHVLVLDLSGVTFMDSTGLNLLLALRARAQAEGGRLELTGVPRQALHVLELTGTRHLFALHPATDRGPGPDPGPGLPPQAAGQADR